MDKKELKKANGDIFLEAERKARNSYIQANWIGIQSIETIMMGSHLLLTMLKRKPCDAILNSNKELIGPWDDGAFFLGTRWARQAKDLGVIYFAQVLSPGIYGQRSFQKFQQLAQQHFQIETFDSDLEAETWLLN